jgi:hypothetical protein
MSSRWIVAKSTRSEMFSAKYYVFLFLTSNLLLPAFLLSPLLVFEQTQLLYGALLILNILGLGFTWRYNSSTRLSFLNGLEIVARSNMSGCANLTMLYIFPVLLIAYYTALFNALIGLKKGKKFTEQKWIRIVDEYEATRLFQ